MANADVSFEESLRTLERLVAEMESGTLSLDDMMRRFEEGRRLVASCTSALESVRRRIEQVVSAPGEPPKVAPLDILK
jgi:exodeoxyribonuclease VII small subunit